MTFNCLNSKYLKLLQIIKRGNINVETNFEPFLEIGILVLKCCNLQIIFYIKVMIVV